MAYMTTKEYKYERVSDWDFSDSLTLTVLHLMILLFSIGLIYSIRLDSDYLSILILYTLFIVSVILTLIGWKVFSERKVYFRRIK